MSGIQFNLLPDVKLLHDKTQRTRQLVTTIAVAASAISFAIFIIMFISVGIIQKKQMDNAGKSVDTANAQLKSIPNLSTIITVQNQLQTLVGLHQSKHITSRIFTYLAQLTPTSVSIGKFDMDLTTNAITIAGNADNQQTVNTFIDTLKSTTYKVGQGTAQNAFPSVVESSFAINPGNVSYSLNLQFDPILFANNMLDAQSKPQTPQLTVPKINTANGQDIFQAQSGNGG